jgi:hypothetical protein
MEYDISHSSSGWLAAIMETLEAERMAARAGRHGRPWLVTDAAVCVHEEGGRVDDR